MATHDDIARGIERPASQQSSQGEIRKTANPRDAESLAFELLGLFQIRARHQRENQSVVGRGDEHRILGAVEIGRHERVAAGADDLQLSRKSAAMERGPPPI